MRVDINRALAWAKKAHDVWDNLTYSEATGSYPSAMYGWMTDCKLLARRVKTTAGLAVRRPPLTDVDVHRRRCLIDTRIPINCCLTRTLNPARPARCSRANHAAAPVDLWLFFIVDEKPIDGCARSVYDRLSPLSYLYPVVRSIRYIIDG